nr:RNA-directed DNA polymerase, eukaryota [Tanacetum cinerariifolium]
MDPSVWYLILNTHLHPIALKPGDHLNTKETYIKSQVDGSRDVDSKKKNLKTCGDDSDLEEVQDNVFEEKGESNHNVDENSSGLKENHSEDPFGFTPNEESDTLDVNKKDNSSKIGHTGLTQKAKKDWVKELCAKHKVNFLALQETKMENMANSTVKMCWGNLAFNFVHSDFVGFSGGILCVWDCNSFRKVNVTVSDSFILIRGVWRKTGNDLLFVAVSAPQDLGEKRRFRSVFNSQGANAFNSFIANAGLEEIPLGGSAFTWCHKSATKISKLDRFFISENLLSTCPNITAVTLDRYLSDHKPILLRESQFDYGPIPFRFFHHWFDVDGFNKIVEDAWCEAPCNESNAMLNLTKKLKRFDKPANKQVQVDMMFPKSISLEQQSDLELEISKEELKKAVWDCDTEKSSGPDGFTFGFYRRFWKSDVFEVVKQFFTLGKLPKGCNSCFIALISKIPDANLVKDFRAITLIGSLYKIIAKILANHLVGVLGDIVHEVQYAFIGDR